MHPLIFSKPLGRGSYLTGKFFGNFFVLVCCQSVFTITLFVLQWVPFSGMVTLPVRVVPYFKHFFIIVVITHLVLAAFYFAAGTLTRNAKIVYGLAACFYPAFIAYGVLLLLNLPTWVRVLFDPITFAFHIKKFDPWTASPDVINQYVATYDRLAYTNRVSMIVVSGIFLSIVYFRFAISEGKTQDEITVLRLSSAVEKIPYSLEGAPSYDLLDSARDAALDRDRVAIPKVNSTEGPATTIAKIRAALGVEFRLLRAERSLIVLVPLAIVLSIFDVAFYRVVPEISYSVTYASVSVKALSLFLVGMIVFYTGEAMHRDREMKIEPVLWSMPAPNSAILLSKWLATVILALGLVTAVAVTAIVVQLVRGHTPVDFSAYLSIFGVVLVPGVIFMSAPVVALNVLLRNKHLAYVIAIGTAVGLYYLYSIGYNHWLYNPLLYRLWTYADLTSSAILAQRVYFLGLAVVCLALAHLLFQRKSK